MYDDDNQVKDQAAIIGKYMHIAVWVIVLLSMFFFFYNKVEDKNNPNQHLSGSSEDEHNTIVLKANRNHQYILSGFINNYRVKFLLDTGATYVSIPAKIAKKLHLSKGRATKAITANGTVTVYQTMLDVLQIGSITQYDVQAHINSGMEDDTVLLGMSVLKHLKIRQEDGKLILTQFK